MTLLQYLLIFAPSLDNFKFSMDAKFRHFIVHCIIAGVGILEENLWTNFGLIAVFVKEAFEITKRAQLCIVP